MLTATPVHGIAPSFSGTLGGSPYIEQLQRALSSLATAVGDTALNPQSTSGHFDCATTKAIARLSCYLKKYLPGTIPSALHGVMEYANVPVCAQEWQVPELSPCKGLAGVADEVAAALQEIVQNAGTLMPLIEQLKSKIMAEESGPASPGTGGRPMFPPLVRVAIRDAPLAVARAVHRYPVGSIAAKEGAIWRVAVPLTTGLSGSFARTHGEVAPATTRPFLVTGPRVPLVPISELTERSRTAPPWYKNWKTYAVIGGVAALGVGAYVVLRKRKRR